MAKTTEKSTCSHCNSSAQTLKRGPYTIIKIESLATEINEIKRKL